MLWLAGLLGLVAVGGAAMAELSPDQEETPANDAPDDNGAGHGSEDLLDALPVLWPPDTGSLPGSMPTDPASENTGATIAGNAADEVLFGMTGNDQLGGYGGDDTLVGRGGRDDLHGHEGDDSLEGGTGADTLHGNAGDDTLFGGPGRDGLFGHTGADILNAGAGDDVAHGGMGNDVLDGGTGADGLHGNHGDDTLTGGEGADALFGGWGNDMLTGVEHGAQSIDYLNGGDGDDLLVAGEGDMATGGTGADIFALSTFHIEADSAELMDFDPAEDRILILYDVSPDAQPEIAVEPDPEIPGRSCILVDGKPLATLKSAAAPEPADIMVIDAGAVHAFGLGGAGHRS